MKTLFDIWNLHPGTNYDFFVKTWESHKREDTSLTDEILYNSFSSYLRWWDISFGKRDPRYIGKSEQKLSATDFVMLKGYKKTYSHPNQLREDYLFGGLSHEKFNKIWKELKSHIRENTSK